MRALPSSVLLLGLLAVVRDARAQQPYPQYGPPPQAYPPPQYGPPPQAYPPPQYGPPPGYVPPPPPPPIADSKRSSGEMTFLYGTSALYGVGSGIWLDSLFKTSDPGIALILPLALGAAAPIGAYFWDDYSKFHRGVPASMATGLSLGAVEGIAIAGAQWQAADSGRSSGAWSFKTETTVTWIFATGGGVGGYAFGEWLRPDPRSLGFIASSAGWGALSGMMFGAGVSGRDWKDGASIAGLIGYNAGIGISGVLSTVYVPSWSSQKYMWLGFLAGTAVASVVYVGYLFSDADPKHGLIANSVGVSACYSN